MPGPGTVKRTFSMKPWIKTFARRGAVALFGIGLLGSVAACSHGAPWGHGRGPMSDEDATKMSARMVERVGQKLDLDAAQKAKLTHLSEVLRAQRKVAMGDKPPHEQMQSLISGNRFDRAGAQALVDSRTEAIRKASPEVIAAAGDFYDSLRPEQQTKVREFLQRGPGGHHRHHGSRGDELSPEPRG